MTFFQDPARAARRARIEQETRDIPFDSLSRYIGSQQEALSQLPRSKLLWLYALYKCASTCSGPSVLTSPPWYTRCLWSITNPRKLAQWQAWSTAAGWIDHTFSSTGTATWVDEARLQYCELVLDNAPACWPTARMLDVLRATAGGSGSSVSRGVVAAEATPYEPTFVDDLLAALEADDPAILLGLCELHELALESPIDLGDPVEGERPQTLLIHLAVEMLAPGSLDALLAREGRDVGEAAVGAMTLLIDVAGLESPAVQPDEATRQCYSILLRHGAKTPDQIPATVRTRLTG
ncbi:hypothetical protein PYCC9005_000955 [Savitreella phatthalungensis]